MSRRRGNDLTELEIRVLQHIVCNPDGNNSGYAINKALGRKYSNGAVHKILNRLFDEGYLMCHFIYPKKRPLRKIYQYYPYNMDEWILVQ